MISRVVCFPVLISDDPFNISFSNRRSGSTVEPDMTCVGIVNHMHLTFFIDLK